MELEEPVQLGADVNCNYMIVCLRIIMSEHPMNTIQKEVERFPLEVLWFWNGVFFRIIRQLLEERYISMADPIRSLTVFFGEIAVFTMKRF